MTNGDVLPTFHELRLRHGISLEALYEYAEQEIDLDEIRLFDETGRADPYTVDDLLFILSKLSGQQYHRANMCGLLFILARPPASPIRPQPQPGYLSARPTLLDLYRAYKLDLNWIGEALNVNNREVWEMLVGPITPRQQPVVQEFLRMVSQYTGAVYILDTIQFTHAHSFRCCFDDYCLPRTNDNEVEKSITTGIGKHLENNHDGTRQIVTPCRQTKRS